MKFLIGKKVGMLQRFRPDGTVVPVTRVKVDPMVITQIKTAERDGYTAVQVGSTGKRKQSKPVRQHTKDLPSLRKLQEFRLDDVASFARGQTFTASVFVPGDIVKVTGYSKGKGFAGVVKRHGFGGSPKTHGHKDQLRMPGSIGATDAQRVIKGKRMAGRMGHEQVSIRNLEIIDVDAEQNELLVLGAVPGARNTILMLTADGDMPQGEVGGGSSEVVSLREGDAKKMTEQADRKADDTGAAQQAEKTGKAEEKKEETKAA